MKATARKTKTPLNTLPADLANSLKMGELACLVHNQKENLQLLSALMTRGVTGEGLYLNFNACSAITRLLDQFSEELAEIGETLETA